MENLHNNMHTKRFIHIDKTVLFCFVYTLLFLKEILFSRTTIDSLFGTIVINHISFLFHIIFILVCLVILIFFQKYLWKEIFVIAGLLITSMISSFYSNSYIFFDFMLLLACSKNINFERFIKYAFYIQSLVIFITISMAYFGIIDNAILIRRQDGTIRNSWGFTHPNTLGILTFQWICEYLYLARNKRKPIKYVILGLLISSIYLTTNSKSSFLMSMLMVLGNIFTEFIKSNRFNKMLVKKFIVISLVLVLAILAVIIKYYWEHPYELSETTLATRIRLINTYFTAYGVNLFGHSINIGNYTNLPGFSYGYYYLDNGVAWLVIKFGLISFIIFGCLYLLFIKKIIVDQRWLLLVLNCGYLVYSLTELTPFMVVFNSLLIGFGGILFKDSLFENKK